MPVDGCRKGAIAHFLCSGQDFYRTAAIPSAAATGPSCWETATQPPTSRTPSGTDSWSFSRRCCASCTLDLSLGIRPRSRTTQSLGDTEERRSWLLSSPHSSGLGDARNERHSAGGGLFAAPKVRLAFPARWIGRRGRGGCLRQQLERVDPGIQGSPASVNRGRKWRASDRSSTAST